MEGIKKFPKRLNCTDWVVKRYFLKGERDVFLEVAETKLTILNNKYYLVSYLKGFFVVNYNVLAATPLEVSRGT